MAPIAASAAAAATLGATMAASIATCHQLPVSQRAHGPHIQL
jgi:hypothetical protein